MCGIVGFLFCNPRDRGDLAAVAERMASTIVHRGPDDSGTWVESGGRAAFGFRRLSILDLSDAGHQPMRSASGRYTVVFNGELYNHLEVRAALGGWSFRGHSDTETLLAGIERWGIRATIDRVSGMFAIAVWDAEREELTLVRDRLGKKPLYVHRARGQLAFASELRAFQALPGFSAATDPAALAAFLRFLYVPAPSSLLDTVRKLEPGHLLTVRGSDLAEVTHEPYWRADGAAARASADPFRGTDAEAIEALDALLGDAVGKRLLSDVPVGALLSGGIDSSLVVGMMAEQAAGPVRTYAVAFPEAAFDESRHAAAIAAHFGTVHTTFDLTEADLLGVVPRLAELFDEPNADPSCVPTYLICALARRDVTVALTGDGGDEVFGGYNRYTRGAPLLRLASAIPAAVRRLFLPRDGSRLLDGAAARFGGGGQQSSRARSHRLRRLLGQESAWGMYEQLVTTGADAALVPWAAAVPAAARVLDDRSRGIVERMMLFDQLQYLPDDLLAKLDRASMAASLEARAPLLDHRIIEFAWRLPTRMKVRGREGKWILRRLLERRLPRDRFERPKMGFSSPIAAWMRGPLRDWTADLVTAVPPDGLLDPSATRRLWAAFEGGADEVAPLMWALAIYRSWEGRWTSDGRFGAGTGRAG